MTERGFIYRFFNKFFRLRSYFVLGLIFMIAVKTTAGMISLTDTIKIAISQDLLLDDQQEEEISLDAEDEKFFPYFEHPKVIAHKIVYAFYHLYDICSGYLPDIPMPPPRL